MIQLKQGDLFRINEFPKTDWLFCQFKSTVMVIQYLPLNVKSGKQVNIGDTISNDNRKYKLIKKKLSLEFQEVFWNEMKRKECS